MRNADDQFAKSLIRETLARVGQAETEVEVASAYQTIDVYAIPDPRCATERAGLRLLGRLGEEPGIFEPFIETPGLGSFRGCQRKQLAWHHELERRARLAAGAPAEGGEDAVSVEVPEIPLPTMHIISPGGPETALRELGFRPVEAGLYAAAPGFKLHAGVLSELPRTRDTLMLRLLGRGRLREEALRDFKALPTDAWERGVATPLLVHFRFKMMEKEAPVDANIEAWWNDYQKQQADAVAHARREGIGEGLKEGREKEAKALLLRVLTTRFGSLPEAAIARVSTADVAEVERWVERAVDAKTLRGVLGGDA